MAAFASPLDWDDLRLINAVAESGTLAAAAAQLGLDHSTVFRRLRRIESVLGTKVFERSRDGYVTTTAGAELATLAARVEEDMTTVLRRVAGLSPSPAGEVRVATSDALLLDLLMPLFAEFQAACPDVRLDLVIGNTALNLSRRDADVAIRATGTPPETLVGRKAARIGWAGYGRSPLAAGAMPGRWVGFGDALAGLAATKTLADYASVGTVAARFDTIGGVAAAVEAGMGAGLLPCFVGDRRAALARVTPPLPELATDLWLLTHEDLRRVPRIRMLLDYLAERLSGLRGLIEGQQPRTDPHSPAAASSRLASTKSGVSAEQI